MTGRIGTYSAGRSIEFAYRVVDNDPSTSGFIIMLLQDTGLEGHMTLRDYETFADILASTNTECSVTSYARKVLTDADLSAPTIVPANDRIDFHIPDQSFGLLETGQTIAASVIGYAPDVSGADSTIIQVKTSIPASPVATDGTEFWWRPSAPAWRGISSPAGQ